MDANPPVVLDTSALIALLLQERGADMVRLVLDHARVSAVNVAESMEVLGRKGGISASDAGVVPGRRIEPFNHQQAITAGNLLVEHRRSNLSLGDACCLALAMSLGADVLTADRAGAGLHSPIQIRFIR